ncbi:hypothetical protein Nmel_014755 [Mimus melanotis]
MVQVSFLPQSWTILGDSAPHKVGTVPTGLVTERPSHTAPHCAISGTGVPEHPQTQQHTLPVLVSNAEQSAQSINEATQQLGGRSAQCLYKIPDRRHSPPCGICFPTPAAPLATGTACCVVLLRHAGWKAACRAGADTDTPSSQNWQRRRAAAPRQVFQLSQLQNIQWHNSDNVEWSTLDENTKFGQDTAAFTRDCLARPAVLRHKQVLRRAQGCVSLHNTPLPTPRTLLCASNTGNGLLDLSERQELLRRKRSRQEQHRESELAPASWCRHLPAVVTRPQQHPGVDRKHRNGTHNDTVLAYVHIGADLGSIDNAVLFYEDMVTNVQREESHPATGEDLFVSNKPTDTARPKITLWSLLSPDGLTDVGDRTVSGYLPKGRGFLPFTELLEGRPDNAATLDHAVPSHPHVGQVTADDAVVHNNRLQKDTQTNPLPLPPVLAVTTQTHAEAQSLQQDYLTILSVKTKLTTKRKYRRLEPPVAVLVMPVSITGLGTEQNGVVPGMEAAWSVVLRESSAGYRGDRAGTGRGPGGNRAGTRQPPPGAHLAVQDDVLAAAQHGLPAHLVAGGLRGERALREKLALLRREYSETVIRLRRARRAERARSHGRPERSPPGGSRGEREAPGRRWWDRDAPGGSRGRCPRTGQWEHPAVPVVPQCPSDCPAEDAPGPADPHSGPRCPHTALALGWALVCSNICSASLLTRSAVLRSSLDNTSPSADRGGPSQLQTKTCSDAATEKTTSVTVKHVPEFSSDEVSPQDSSRIEGFQASQENLCCGVIRPVPVEKKPQTSQGMMKLRKRMKALEAKEGEPVHDVHLISAGEMMKNQIASAEELQSPVFRRSSLSHTEEPAQRASGALLVQGERNSFTPDAPSGVVQDVFEGSVTAGEPEPSPHVLRDSRDIWQPESPGAVATPDRHEPCSQHEHSVLLDPRGDGGEESPSIIKQPEGLCEDQGELRGLLDLTSENEILLDSRNNTKTEESKNHEGHQSDTSTLNPCPADNALDNAEEVLENQQAEVQSRLSPPDNAPESTLSSCTVVEGLLFPLEYYVRTTRRMSNCQRKVDLDAVILSQLGRSKKAQRSKCKQKDANPSQETPEGDLEPGAVPFPFLEAENDQGNSGSSQKSLPASGSSSSSTCLESISQKSIPSTRQEQKRSQRKQKGRRKSACKAPMHPASQELIESQDPTAANGSSALLSNENQSEKENCDANLEKSSSEERRLCDAASLGSAGTGAPQPEGPAPALGGSQVPGKCHKALVERAQNPLQSSDSLSPGSDTSASCVGHVEASTAVCQGGRHPVGRVKRQRGARGAGQLPGVSVPVHRSLRCSARHGAHTGSPDDSSRGHSCPMGSQGPAALGLPAVDPDTRGSLFSFRSLQWLVPQLGIRDFHLPNEEFGVLKLEKLKSSPVNDLEDFVSGDGVAPEDTPDAQMKPKDKGLRSNLILPSKTGLPELPCIGSPVSKKELSTHELLFTPLGTVLAGAPIHPESQISSSVFPAVGATPGVLPSVHSEVTVSGTPVPASATPPSPRGAAALVLGDVAHRDPAVPLHPDSCAAGAATNQEEQGTTFPTAAERGSENKSDDSVCLDKHQQSENKEQESCRASPEPRKDTAEQLTPVLLDGPGEESLQFVSELKDSSCSCSVDVSTVWWAAAGHRELRVVTASESTVSLWQPLAPNCWGKVYTWHLREIPVIQIVPLPDTCNLVCVALGELEIGEIRLLLYSSETDSFEHSLVKTGNIKAVVGLKDQRLVSSSRTMQEQQVEMVSFSETGGRKDRQALMPPEETVTAFAEVEGMREALVGTTAGNSVVVWNLKTGQLLRKMPIGYSYPASICHRAYSDSGLLFVVLSHPHAKESESCGSPAFRVVAFNPRTGRSVGVMYLEGDVWGTAGAAVLTSGAVAVWDLLRGRCTAVLPAGPAGHWALARWASGGAGLLAGHCNGTVHLYRYRPPQPGAA